MNAYEINRKNTEKTLIKKNSVSSVSPW